jgi:hypothetical protein
MIQSCQRFNENISSLIAELGASRNEEVKCLVQIEIEVTEEVVALKLVNFLLGRSVEVLKLVNG